MSSSCPDSAAIDRDVDSKENRHKFIEAREATTYDNLLLDGSISNADVRSGNGWSGLHRISEIGLRNFYVDTDILLSYLLTSDPPADVNGRAWHGATPMWYAAMYNDTSTVKILIDFDGDRLIKTELTYQPPNSAPLDIAKINIAKKNNNNQKIMKLLTECFPSEK
jgi:hypothetical protein